MTQNISKRESLPWVGKFHKAIEMLGGQTSAGRSLGISQQRVYFILNKAKAFPSDLAPVVERATAGRITRADLRPDLFGDLSHVPSLSRGLSACHPEKDGEFPCAS